MEIQQAVSEVVNKGNILSLIIVMNIPASVNIWFVASALENNLIVVIRLDKFLNDTSLLHSMVPCHEFSDLKSQNGTSNIAAICFLSYICWSNRLSLMIFYSIFSVIIPGSVIFCPAHPGMFHCQESLLHLCRK